MPTTTTLTVPVLELRPHDVLEHSGEIVKHLRILAKNVDVTFESGSVRRIAKTTGVVVRRTEPTDADRLAEAEVTLHGTAVRLIEEAANVSHNTVRDELNARIDRNGGDVGYTLSWYAEEVMESAHRVNLFMGLTRLVERREGVDPVDVVTEWLEHLMREQRDWRPSRSTSPSSNLNEEAKYNALRRLLHDGIGGLASFRFWSERVAELRALVD